MVTRWPSQNWRQSLLHKPIGGHRTYIILWVSWRSCPICSVDAGVVWVSATGSEGCPYSDRGPDQGFPSGPFGWSGTRRLFP
jgi:hypothetical protein